MKRVVYLVESNSRLTRAFLGLRAVKGTLGERVVELYLPTQSVLSVVGPSNLHTLQSALSAVALGKSHGQ